MSRRLLAICCAAVVAAGCHVWAWSSGSGTHEVSFPPVAQPTPEPTPLDRY